VKHEKIIKEARERWDDSAAAEHDQRALFKHDTAFENGDQWSEKELQDRAGRPCIVINKVAGAVKQITGEARKNRPSIKIRPVDSLGDPKVAELFSGLIRNIENVSDAESAYDTGYENAVRGGYGYWRIITEYTDGFDQDIKIQRIVNPAAVYMDQSSICPQYSDAEYAFITEEISKKKYDRIYKGKRNDGVDQGVGEEQSGWFAKETVRVAEYFYKVPVRKYLFELMDGKTIEVENPDISTAEVSSIDSPSGSETVNIFTSNEYPEPIVFKRARKIKTNKIMWCKINGHEVLEGPTELPGKYIPIIFCAGEEVWIDGKRLFRSAVRHSIDAQKLYNWSRSNMVETLALAPKQPVALTQDEIEGYETEWQQAHSTPKAYILYNETGHGRPQPMTPSIPNTGAQREALVAADDIKATTGIYDASLGARGNETSGKAISARTQQANTATFVFVDNQARAIKYTAKVLVDLIPKVYDTQRVVRILNEDGSEAWAEVNATDPVSGQKINDLSVGKYDVVYDIGPDFATRRMEAADGLLKLAQTSPEYQSVLIPKIAKNLDWPGSVELGQELQELSKPQPPPPEEQAKIQMELQGRQLDLKEKEVELQGKGIELESKKLEVEKTRLEVLKVQKELAMPRQPTAEAGTGGK